MSAVATDVSVEVDGRRLRLSNLDKVLYPATGFTKAEVIDYYRRIADVLLPHIAYRPLTVIRYPDGVGRPGFLTKSAPAHRPEWVQTVRLPSPASARHRSHIDYLLVTDRAALIWLANLAALELHTPIWRVTPGGRRPPPGAAGAASSASPSAAAAPAASRAGPQARAPAPGSAGHPGGSRFRSIQPEDIHPDVFVADLDPGPPATVVECARVALALRERLPGPLCVKTSGSKGLQVYGRVDDGRSGGQVRADMKRLAERLERELPGLVVANMRRSLRRGRVLVDWSQNNPTKTTVSVYSLRGRRRPTVSTPVTWAEVEAVRSPEDLVFTAADVLDRVAEHGDLFAPMLGAGQAGGRRRATPWAGHP